MKKMNIDQPSIGSQALKCFMGVVLLFLISSLFYGFYENVIASSILTLNYAYINSQYIVLPLLAVTIFMGCLARKIEFSQNYYGTGIILSLMAVVASIAYIYRIESLELESRRDFIFGTMYFAISIILTWRFGHLLEKNDPDTKRLI